MEGSLLGGKSVGAGGISEIGSSNGRPYGSRYGIIEGYLLGEK